MGSLVKMARPVPKVQLASKACKDRKEIWVRADRLVIQVTLVKMARLDPKDRKGRKVRKVSKVQ
jgi:hypothetical protein